MLFVLSPLTRVNSSTLCCQCSFSFSHVILPRTFISVLLSAEKFTLAWAFIRLPLANIKLIVIVIAMTVAFSHIMTPLSMVLVIATLLLIRAIEDALTISDVSAFQQNLPFVMIAITVGVPSKNSQMIHILASNRLLLLSCGMLGWQTHICRHVKMITSGAQILLP